MEQIASILYIHSKDNGGALPHRLADLVPEFTPNITGVFFFSSPYSQSVVPTDALSHPELIDIFSPYTYFKLSDGRIVVTERPGLWRDGKITYFLRGEDGQAVGRFSSCHVTPEEFERRLRLNFPDQPLRGDYQKTFSTNIGSHHYAWGFTGRELEKVQSAFKASGKPPITAEAARAKVRAALESPEPEASWDVAEGVPTSDGSTPYYHFHCEYLKNGQKMGQSLGAMVLMDGTVIAPKLVK